jgi:hypothetical protein
MTEPAKCVCGADVEVTNGVKASFVLCTYCGWGGALKPSEAESVAAWNACMRPRPVAFIKQSHAFIDGSMVGCIVNTQDLSGYYVYLFSRSYESDGAHGTFDHCRAWLIAKLTAAGFDVKESE